MTLISKRAFLIVLVPAVVCLMARYALCYWCGYDQRSWAPIFFQELLALFGFILTLIALVAWIVSYINGQQFAWTTALLTSLFAMYFLPSPHDLILYGLRTGMLRNYGLDSMRQFARDFDKLPYIPQNNLDGRTKFYWARPNEDLDKTQLKDKYPFLVNCESVVEWDNRVSADWGGFENHWQIFVATDGKRIDPEHLEPRNRIIRVGDDIYFMSDY
jgi:hypothetical protein